MQDGLFYWALVTGPIFTDHWLLVYRLLVAKYSIIVLPYDVISQDFALYPIFMTKYESIAKMKRTNGCNKVASKHLEKRPVTSKKAASNRVNRK